MDASHLKLIDLSPQRRESPRRELTAEESKRFAIVERHILEDSDWSTQTTIEVVTAMIVMLGTFDHASAMELEDRLGPAIEAMLERMGIADRYVQLTDSFKREVASVVAWELQSMRDELDATREQQRLICEGPACHS